MKPVIRKTNNGYQLESCLWLPRAIDEVFAFFADAANLDAITPPWLKFRVLTPMPITMRSGLLLDYSLRMRGLPIKWRSEITAWEPPYRFVDEQRRGPYRHWVHEHRFEESNGGTNVVDRVDYAVPGGGLIHRMFVGPDLVKIFHFRMAMLTERFGAGDAEGEVTTAQPSPRS